MNDKNIPLGWCEDGLEGVRPGRMSHTREDEAGIWKGGDRHRRWTQEEEAWDLVTDLSGREQARMTPRFQASSKMATCKHQAPWHALVLDSGQVCASSSSHQRERTCFLHTSEERGSLSWEMRPGMPEDQVRHLGYLESSVPSPIWGQQRAFCWSRYQCSASLGRLSLHTHRAGCHRIQFRLLGLQ